jgi:hypothetical protein
MKLFVFPVANGEKNVSFLSEFRANSPGDAYVQQLCNPATMLLYMTLSECYSQPYTSKRQSVTEHRLITFARVQQYTQRCISYY